MTCPICNSGKTVKKYINIPVKENGVITSYLRVVLNGRIHRQLMLQAGRNTSLYITKIK